MKINARILILGVSTVLLSILMPNSVNANGYLLPLALSLAAQAQTTAPGANNPTAPHTAAIPFDQIGAVAGKQYSGDGLAVAATPDGATLRCVFQRLSGKATAQGLWLVSTKDGDKGEPFRVVALELGREALVGSLRRDDRMQPSVPTLPATGKVEVENQVVRFIRPGLTEEYSAGIDGLRQDFVIEQRPVGNGQLRLELDVDGARAEAMPAGARLVLDDGGRQMVYNRLNATDAKGKQLAAKLEVLSPNRLAVVLDDNTAQYPVRIDPTFSDANWISFGEAYYDQFEGESEFGVGGTVYATAVDSAGNLYVGGNIDIAGSVSVNNIAEWNGSSWSALGSGISGSYSVAALAVSGNTLYVGGYFTSAGGVAATNIAEWNGTNWSALGSGITFGGTSAYAVNALAVSGTNLYVGGSFTSAGGVAATNIAEWNGTSWSALSSGIGGGIEDGPGPWVSSLAVSGNTLYVGGFFTMAGDALATNIAEWNGSSWSALGSGISGIGGTSFPFPSVSALAVSGTNLYAGGGFTMAGDVLATNIAEWNGSSWSALGLGVSGGSVLALAMSGTNLYAGGNFTMAGGTAFNSVAQWNGNSWLELSPGVDNTNTGYGVAGSVYSLTVSGNTLFVGGNFGFVGDINSGVGVVLAHSIARWNGSSWSAMSSGLDNTVYALAVSGTNLYAGGGFYTADGTAANYIAQWNGGGWSALGTGIGGNFQNEDSPPYIFGAPPVCALAVSGTNVYAGGVNGVTLWNGSTWSALGSGINGTVNALAVSGTNLYVGGDFTTAGDVAANNIAEWNGNSWSPLGSGMNAPVSVLAASGNTLYAGGGFTSAGGVLANGVAQWNGSSWSPLGSGLNSYVQTLVVLGNTLYAGGFFWLTGDGSNTLNYVAQWNGSSWSPLGSGMNGQVFALAVSGDTLYAGGGFTKAGGVAATNIAEWNGSTWSALGSGASGDFSVVYALAVSGNMLYVGGNFLTAGTNVSDYMARAIIAPPTVTSISASVGGPITLNVGGLPGANRVWATTDPSLPLSQWQVISTNVAGADGLFQFTDPSTAGIDAKFYSISSP